MICRNEQAGLKIQMEMQGILNSQKNFAKNQKRAKFKDSHFPISKFTANLSCY